MKYNKKEIRMLPINPRYTYTYTDEKKVVDFKNLDFPEYSEISVAKKLLEYEGDLSDLLELIISIKKDGFIYINDKILIHLDKNENFYYTVEGNRRLLAINLINKKFSFDDVCGEEPFYKYTNKSKWKKNRKNIIFQINESKGIKYLHEWFSDVSSQDKKIIWKIIYSKHAGEQVGKRNWPRGKYFHDLLEKFEDINKNKHKENKNKHKEFDDLINELSSWFSKKVNTIKQDIRSAIWVINSFKIYNKSYPNSRVDLKQMEVSAYELLLSKKLWFDGQEKTLIKILNIEIDIKNLKFSYNTELEKIIAFLVLKFKEKNITTREIKDEVFDELSYLIGDELSYKKNLNYVYIKLKEKHEKKKLTYIEKYQYEFLDEIKKNDKININEFIDCEYDSKFIKSIKYIFRNDLKTLSNFRKLNEDEFPFTSVALSIRNIIDLLILEFFYRIEFKKEKFFKELKCSKEEIKLINYFISNYNNSIIHNVGEITSVVNNIVDDKTKGSSYFTEIIKKLIKEKYSKRLEKLGINIDEFSIQSILNYKKKTDSSEFKNFSLLNNLVHKPYLGFENKDNAHMIDNLTIMYRAVKTIMKELKNKN